MIGLPDYDLIAEVCDKAHDEMLVRGKATGEYVDTHGSVCLIGAVYAACGRDAAYECVNPSKDYLADEQRLPVFVCNAIAGFKGVDPGIIYTLSDDRTIDFTLDVFRDTAKAARNGEL